MAWTALEALAPNVDEHSTVYTTEKDLNLFKIIKQTFVSGKQSEFKYSNANMKC